MPWLRLWDDALDSPKVHRLKPELFRAWIFLLLAAKRHDTGGVLPDTETIAFWMRATEEQVEQWTARLVEVGLIERSGEGLVMHDWEHWQEPPDRTAAQRMRRMRESKKAKKAKKPDSPPSPPSPEESRTEQSRGRNRCATPTVTKNTLRRNGDVTERDYEEETEGNGVTDSSPPPPAPRDPDADRVCNLAAEIGGDIGWAMWAENRLRLGDTPKAIEAALNEAVNANIIQTSYVGKILGRYAVQGVPTVKASTRGRSGPADYRPNPVPASPLPSMRPAGPAISEDEARSILFRKSKGAAS